MTWGVQLAIALAIALAAGWAGIEWEQGQQAQLEVQRERIEQERIARIRVRHDKAAAGYEADKRQIRTVYVPITQEVERVVEKPFYSDLCLDDDGLRSARRAIAGTGAASEPARAVPAEPAGAR